MSFSFGGSSSSSSSNPFNDKLVERDNELKQKFKKYSQTAMVESYYMVCIKKCFQDYSSPLDKTEKICLAKCLDRAYDYYSLNEDQLNPYSRKLNLQSGEAGKFD